ncbi:MAG: MobF family relaxase [Gemmataceae bacterium]
MLRITQQRNAAAAKAYYSKADYYSEGRELVGTWEGEAAKMLGLVGPVKKAEFDRVCDNLHPANDNRLTVRTKDDRTVGYDFTWSVSKSYSALYGLTEDAELLRFFQETVSETMRDIEAEMKTRVREKGEPDRDRTTGNAVWATFTHFTSRPEEKEPPDPQLHAHGFMFNVTFDPVEQRLKAGQFRDLKRDAPFWQAAFRARLAAKLQAAGYALVFKDGDFEIAGVPQSVIDKFSRRTAKIEKVAKEKGIVNPKEKDKLGAKTRAKKDSTLTWEELRLAWRERLTPEELQAIEAAHARTQAAEHMPARDAEAASFAVAHCFEKESVVAEKQLLTQALRHGLGAVSVDGVRQAMNTQNLIVREIDGRRMATTPAILAEEERMLDAVREGRGVLAPLVGRHHPIARDWLNADQRRAVKHLWESPDRFLFIRGAAGVGKTTLLQEAREGIEAAGMRIVALAPTAAASRGVLRDEGFAGADTLARFLVDEKMQQSARGQVILLDEAGLVSGRDMAKLVQLTGSLNARLVLVGDVRQHTSPGAYGTPLKLLEKHAGCPVVEVAEIRRQKGSYRGAVERLRDGLMEEGISQLDALGWVKEVPETERYRLLATDYLRTVAEKKRGGGTKSALVVSPTHKEAALATQAIRDGLRAAKKIGDERELPVWVAKHLTEAERKEERSYQSGDLLQFHKNAPGHKSGSRLVVRAGEELPLASSDRFQVFRPETLAIASGDTLRVTVGGKSKDGHRLDNGMLLKVKGFTEAGDILTDQNWVIDKDWGHLAHGYCVTSHASQGRTVDRVLIAQSAHSLPASGREQFYVSVSRGKEQALIYCDDKEALKEAVKRSEKRLTAIELVGTAKQPWHKRMRKHLASLAKREAILSTHHAQNRQAGREIIHE